MSAVNYGEIIMASELVASGKPFYTKQVLRILGDGVKHRSAQTAIGELVRHGKLARIENGYFQRASNSRYWLTRAW